MSQWRKLGRVFDPGTVGDRPWLKAFAQAPAALIRDGIVRMYFSCRPEPDADGQYVSYSAFVDLDRRDLFKVRALAEEPILPLGQPGTFDEFGVYPVSVISTGAEVRAYYAGWTRCRSVPFNTAIGCAVSRDGGSRFERLGPGPIIAYSPDEPFVMSGPKVRRFGATWYLFYIAGRVWKSVEGRPEPVYRIRMATSADGLSWTKVGRDLIPPRIEADEAQASPDVFEADGRFHMHFCYRHSEGFRGRERGYRIGYAWSTDLLHWTRDDERCGIDVSEEGWDSEMISYPHVFAVDGQVYLAYLGNGVGRAGFGLAAREGGFD
ncbi:glycoside hydrolase family protein [Methylobacterium planeticum]|uniref:Glycosylase n=1 Tax=Methylobacterium planeticum TaxID=2615211 RepID=A0A6N6N0S2_9HYPH|nr:glycosylase [Methylobacterium planeticum]KAB1076072.1 glycosylase [Methylobacterium planeticum]